MPGAGGQGAAAAAAAATTAARFVGTRRRATIAKAPQTPSPYVRKAPRSRGTVAPGAGSGRSGAAARSRTPSEAVYKSVVGDGDAGDDAAAKGRAEARAYVEARKASRGAAPARAAAARVVVAGASDELAVGTKASGALAVEGFAGTIAAPAPCGPSWHGGLLVVCGCVEINRKVGCGRTMTESSGARPTPRRHRAGVASMAWRS